ncbi:phage tail protein [Rhizobium sp. WYCCWR10014]|uniref:siderophore-interacting protein n=1 Tax=Rhizobium sp. WYCCWR10014 TaxID=1825933 RepID=UPI0007E4A4A2|nr:siderophore-interacting protein [Rhizobium sp. WYCCWR10014]OAV48970.1 phage tail protein [Rhizobium sp. WYCCWR10014]
MMAERFTVSGVAVTADPGRMLDEICTHFVEHGTVTRNGDAVTVETMIGKADISRDGPALAIELSCRSARALQNVRAILAEHLFDFAGEETLELNWSDAPKADRLPDLREIRVIGATNITPHMRRVTVVCDDTRHFADGGLHFRLLIPPKGRPPVWPQLRTDGRIQWASGEDALTVRIYTIRNLDVERGEMEIDFVLHEGENMPGAEWAINAKPGDIAGALGPGGGGVPDATSIILAGDETALPAISRIAAEIPEGRRLKIFLEIDSVAEEQSLPSAGIVDVTWMYRNGKPAGTMGLIEKTIKNALLEADADTFVWAGCERAEAKRIRDFLKTERGHDRQRMSIGAYWER